MNIWAPAPSVSFTTAATSSGEASGFTALSLRICPKSLNTVSHTYFELSFHALPVLLSVVPFYLLVVLQHFHELLPEHGRLFSQSTWITFGRDGGRRVETYLVPADRLVLRPRRGKRGQCLDLLLQLIAQAACLPNQVVQQSGILPARAIVRSVQSTRVELGDAGNVAAESRNAFLDVRDLRQHITERQSKSESPRAARETRGSRRTKLGLTWS